MTLPYASAGDAALSEISEPLPRIALPPKLFVPLPRVNDEVIATKPLGKHVRRGESLLKEDHPGLVAVLSPADGVLGEIVSRSLTSGRNVDAIELLTDPATFPRSAPQFQHPAADFAEFIRQLEHAGVCADRCTSPDLHTQLRRAKTEPPDTIICNMLGEAPARLNGALAADFSQEIVSAVERLRHFTGAGKAWIVASAGFDRSARPLRRAARRAGIRYVPMLNSYPMSDPTLLLFVLLSRRLKPGRSPIEQRVMLIDGVAAVAIGQLMLMRAPMLDVPINIRDGLRGRWHVVTVPIGTRVRDVCEQLSISTTNITIRAGDVLRDVQIDAESIIATSELSLDVSPEMPPVNPDPCIRCGWCVQACPSRIHPAGLLEAAQSHDMHLAERYGLQACIECGICSYVCPAHLPLLPSIRGMRSPLIPSPGTPGEG